MENVDVNRVAQHRNLDMCRIVCKEVHTMATNLAIDPDLLERALAIGGEKTKKATVTRALEEYIQRRAQPKIRASRGQFDDWDPTFDYKASRRARDRKLGLTE